MKRLALALPLLFTIPAAAQEAEPPTPASIVAASRADEWVAIALEDLLVMDLAPDAAGRPRRVVIQLMPAPFSQPWVDNIRTLARAHWWDGTQVYRVVDNWVAQWGAGEDEDAGFAAHPLPEGVVSPVADYHVEGDALSAATEFTPDNLPPYEQMPAAIREVFDQPTSTHEQRRAAIEQLVSIFPPILAPEIRAQTVEMTQTPLTEQGWHDRDGYADWVEFWKGWPIANSSTFIWRDGDGKPAADLGGQRSSEATVDRPHRSIDQSKFWPIHCYGSVGVARDLAPDTGTGAELYAVIGHAPRQLDRNIAVVGRVIAGIEHLSTLPRGTADAGVYATRAEDVPILSVRLGNELPDPPRFEYLGTESESFARYVQVRANRHDAFYQVPAGGVDVCNVQVPIRPVATP